MQSNQPERPDARHDPLVFVREAISDLGVYLSMWRHRSDPPDPADRAAVDLAVERINTTIHRLERVRAQLVDEIRPYEEEGWRDQ